MFSKLFKYHMGLSTIDLLNFEVMTDSKTIILDISSLSSIQKQYPDIQCHCFYSMYRIGEYWNIYRILYKIKYTLLFNHNSPFYLLL